MVDTKDFSTILSGLVNDFPAIGAREIRFGELGDKSGVGIYPSAAATVISEKTDIMGGVYQKCNYAFLVVYRAVPQSETDRIHIKGWLDKLARWLEKQPITADGRQHTLAAWPDLGDGRTIICTGVGGLSGRALCRRCGRLGRVPVDAVRQQF